MTGASAFLCDQVKLGLEPDYLREISEGPNSSARAEQPLFCRVSQARTSITGPRAAYEGGPLRPALAQAVWRCRGLFGGYLEAGSPGTDSG